MKYRKKPVVIEAKEFTHETAREIELWSKHKIVWRAAPPYEDNSNEWLEIPTLEGTMRAEFGDFIIQGVQGEFYPCKPDIFEATYEAV